MNMKKYLFDRKWVQLLFMAIVLLISSIHVQAQHLHIYGGDNHDVYLGCLTSSPYDSKSIWNEYGTYGNEYSSYSPWNEYASNPPVIVDKEGKFYGYFTVNKYKSQRADFKLVLLIYEYRELIKENLQKWYDKLFE